MKRILFFNLTQHELLKEQKEKAVKELGVTEFLDISEFSPSLKVELSNCPSDLSKLEKLSTLILGQLLNLEVDYDIIYLHLPIGSPAFMWILSRDFYNSLAFLGDKIIPVFSHSERKVIEEMKDGKVVKKSVFEFKDFIPIVPFKDEVYIKGV